jgi:hypothetical protein
MHRHGSCSPACEHSAPQGRPVDSRRRPTRALQLTSAVLPTGEVFRCARGLSRRASFDAIVATRAPADVVAFGSVLLALAERRYASRTEDPF